MSKKWIFRLLALFALSIYLIIVVFAMGGCCFLLQGKTGADSIVPDPDLNKAVRSQLKKSRFEPLTGEDIGTLHKLHITGYLTRPFLGPIQVKNLQGLEYAKNLKVLYLYQHFSLSDLAPLSGLLQLEELYIENAAISNISSLKELKNLRLLFLMNNNINDIMPLDGLKNLVVLNLSVNKIEDVSGLKDLESLLFLALNHNSISELGPLLHLDNLVVLELDNNRISDIAPLANMEELIEISLDNNNISDISALAGAKNLKYLYIGNNSIKDISCIVDFTELRHLYIHYNSIEDFSPLLDMANLENLNISGNLFDKDNADFLDFVEELRASGVRVVYDGPAEPLRIPVRTPELLNITELERLGQ